MKQGRKPDLRASKAARGTLKPYRDVFGQIEAPAGAVIPPQGSLTDEGALVWEDLAPVAIALGTLKPADAESFAILCCLTAFIRAAHRAGEPPPASYYAEQRRRAELFGIAGERSRTSTGSKAPPASNPFFNNGRRIEK